jgi:hypothetical protein
MIDNRELDSIWPKGTQQSGEKLLGAVEQLISEAETDPDAKARLLEAFPEVVKTENIEIADMPDSVLDGKLGDLCLRNLIATGLPVAYAWPALITVASHLVPNGKQPTERPALFTCLVGETHSGKSVSVEHAMRLLGVEKTRWPVFTTKAGSAEGLAKVVKDKEGEPVLWYLEELAHMLKKAAIQNASFPQILQELYSSNFMPMVVAEQQELLFNARLSIIGGLPTNQFQSAYTAETVGGFYQRSLFGLMPTEHQYLYTPYDGEVVTELKLLPARTDSSVWEARDAYAARTPNPNGRIIESCLRVAAICAAFDGREVLRGEDLAPTWAFCDYQHKVREVLKPAEGITYDAVAAGKVMTCLKKHTADGKWLKQRDILAFTNAYELGPRVYEQAIDSLVRLGLAECKKQKPSNGGRTTVLLRVAGDECLDSPVSVP